MLKLVFLSFFIFKLCNCVGEGVDPTDKECIENEICKRQNDCREFLDKKSQLTRLTKGGSDFKAALVEIKGWVCNKKRKAVCCRVGDDAVSDSTWLPGKGECGLNPHGSASRVLGGVKTAPGQFPFTALLGYPVKTRTRNGEVKKTLYKCGGTLINHWYVVTAAHCQGKTTGSQISSVRLGEWEVGRDPDCIRGSGTCLDKVQDFRITFDQVRVHEDFGRSSTGNIVNDIALVRLDRPAVLNKGVQIVCLPLDHDAAADELNLPNLEDGLTGKYPHVVGWGYTEYDPTVSGQEQGDFSTDNVASTVQQMLGVPVLSAEECDELWGGKLAVEETQICAGGQRGKDSCKGDSGGPLYLARVTSSGLPLLDGLEPVYLLGLVSFGSRVCGEGRPGVYTRLSSFMPWIKEHIGRGDK